MPVADGDGREAAALLESLETIGIHLWLEDSTLRYRAPKGVMTPERLAALRARREEVMALLRSAAGPAEVSHDEARRYEPFPVTDVQAAYLTGRSPSYPYGGVGCHGYGELSFDGVDPGRLDAAWRALIQRHDMLRAVISADGTQWVHREQPDYHIDVQDLGAVSQEKFDATVEATRANMDHRVYQAGEWPLFDLRLTLSADRAILHFSVDFLIADFVSIQVLLDELEEEYRNPGSASRPLAVTFRDLLLASRAARSEGAAQRDRAYWWDRIDELPGPPELPVAAGAGGTGPVRFGRLLATLPGPEWERFQQRARGARLTPTCAVLAAYAEVIRRWSRQADFTVNVTVLNRPAIHPQIRDIVGDFTSVELLAIQGGQPSPFRGRAQAVQATLWEDLDHGLCSGIDVMRELRKRRAEGLTIFPVVFTSSIGLRGERKPGEHAPGDGKPGGGLDRLVRGISQTPQVWLDCQVMETGQGLAFNWDVREGIFPPGLAEVMFGAFERLLHDLAAGDEPWSSPCPVPVPAEQLATRPPRPTPATLAAARRDRGLLHDKLLAQASATPDRPAVVAGARTLSYGELAGLAGSVAQALGGHGCQPGSIVAVEMDKGWEQIPAVAGVLMRGCAFVPVDTSQPPSRRDRILSDVGARAILTQSWLAGRDRGDGVPAIAVDTLAPVSGCGQPGGQGADLAYVMYTSGSTGTPKGVMISHQAALNTIEDVTARFGVHAGDRVLALANLGFDLSVYDIFGLLSIGGSLVLPEAQRRGDPAHWAELIDRHQVTVWNSVPAQLEMLMAYLCSGTAPELTSLRLGLLSGDWIPLSLPETVWERLPGLRLISLGGATEASIWSIFHPIDAVDRELPSIPYGRPLAGQGVEVLGRDMFAVPDLVAGDIWISGAGLSDGYLGDAAKTAERFVRHPRTGERLYRTGDLGRYLPGGTIEFLGREDSQVKIRGHRVELAEIEAALTSHPSVAAAAVITIGQRPDPIRLAAFVEPAARPEASAPAGPATAELSAVALAGAASLRAEVDDQEMLAFARELDATALLQMLATLRGAGLFATEADSHSLAEIMGRTRVAPRHQRLVRRWLRALADNGLVRHDPADGSYSGAAAADAEAVAQGWARVERLVPEVERRTELISYFQTTAGSLPELVSGEVDPLTLLFPEGRTEIHEVAYNGMFLSRYLNRLLITAACHLAGRHAGPEPFKVLEVGSGVGGTSVDLIAALASFDVEYLFSDVSEFFLNNARRRFAEHPWVSYALYDMNRDFRAQGLLPNSYDVIVCANVLHYAHSVDDALRRLKQLVKPGGWLLLIEATRDSYQIMTSMEFLFDETSGEFEDVRRLREQTFVEREQWLDVLAAAGADGQLCLPERDPITDQMGMHFFAARFKSGRVPVVRPDLERHLTKHLPDHMLPTHLQVIDELPHTGNGKVDRNTLRSWLNVGAASAAAADTGELPSGEVEQGIAEVWQRLLRVEKIGRHQNFFEMGGDSLLAAQVASEIRQDVPHAPGLFYDDLLRLILQNATVASLAGEIGRDGADHAGQAQPVRAASPLVQLGDLNGESPGLAVLVHDGTGTLAGCRPLTETLAGVTSLAGLAVPDAAAYLSRPVSGLIDEVAAEYVQALATAGHGRLRLAGRGIGGILAAEVARQLTEAGTGVEDLVVIAASPPVTPDPDEVISELLFWRELGVGAARLGYAPGGQPGYDPASLLEHLRSEPREARFGRLAGLLPGVSLEEIYEVFLHSTAAAAAHELLPYAGDMTLVRPPASLLWPVLPDEMAGYWQETCLGDLRIVDLDVAAEVGYLDEAAPVLSGLLAGRSVER